MTIKDIEFWTRKILEADGNVKIVSKAIGKMESGIKKYGEFDPVNDKREFIEELLKELYDGINYCLLGAIKEPAKEVQYSDLLKEIVFLVHYVEQRLR